MCLWIAMVIASNKICTWKCLSVRLSGTRQTTHVAGLVPALPPTVWLCSLDFNFFICKIRGSALLVIDKWQTDEVLLQILRRKEKG